MLESEKTSTYPKYLYHYTSIQALAQILRTKQLRFNRLDKVDDLQEANAADLGDIGRLYFVSCWSDSDEESIPLWSMYTPNKAGVRIKLPITMIRKYTIPKQSDGFVDVTEELLSPLPYERMISREYFVNPFILNPNMFLRKVEYTNDETKLNPTLKSEESGRNVYALGNVGICKTLEWQFQNEWRYILMIHPTPLRNNMPIPKSQWMERLNFTLQYGLYVGSLPFDEFCLDLEISAINEIEVVLGPKCTDGDETIVDSLLSRYCMNPTVRSSALKGLIR